MSFRTCAGLGAPSDMARWPAYIFERVEEEDDVVEGVFEGDGADKGVGVAEGEGVLVGEGEGDAEGVFEGEGVAEGVGV